MRCSHPADSRYLHHVDDPPCGWSAHATSSNTNRHSGILHSQRPSVKNEKINHHKYIFFLHLPTNYVVHTFTIYTHVARDRSYQSILIRVSEITHPSEIPEWLYKYMHFFT